MMCEIKFRAWDSDAECFAYSHIEDDNYVWGFEGGKLKAWAIIEVPATNDEPTHAGSVELETPDLYTTRLDKNGTEIYEGDITNEGVVEWCGCLNWDSGGSKHPGFYFKDKYDGEMGELEYHTGFGNDIEVIGNVHESPELSKEVT